MSSPTMPQRPAKRRLILTAVVLAALALTYFLTRGRLGGAASAPADSAAGGGAPAMPPMPVDVDTARRQSIVDAVRATGRIEAVQAVDLRPDEQGRVTGLLFREGQFVASGTPLVRIDDAMLRA